MNYFNENQGLQINAQVFDKFSFAANTSTRSLILWNKFQILVYEDFNNFKDTPVEYAPDFIITKVVPSKQYLICLDCNGNVHTISTRNKKLNNKRLKTGFLPRDKGICNIVYFNQELFLTLKIDTEKIYLVLHKVCLDFIMIGRYCLECDLAKLDVEEQLEKSILKCLQINESDKQVLKNAFKMTDFPTDNYLVIMSFDRKTVYGCIFNPKSNEVIELKKIYTCPLEICDIIIECTYSDIVLRSGTVIHINFEENTQIVVHLNSGVSSVCKAQNSIFYTNGNLMWKAEHYFTKNNVTFIQLLHRNCRDFIIVEDKIISITYSNMIYIFDANSDKNYIKNCTKKDYYYTAESLLSNTESFNKIFDEIDKTQILCKQIQIESHYLAAVALAYRQDIMNNILKYHLYLYDNYEASKCLENLTLTHKLEEYFETDCILINLKMELSEQSEIKPLLNCLSKDFKLHISFSNRKNLITVVSVNITKIGLVSNYLIPVKIGNNSPDLMVKVNLVAALPGPLDVKQKIWTNISRKEITVPAEQFIITTTMRKNMNNLKDNIDESHMLINILESLYGTKFDFTENIAEEKERDFFKLYIKLPKDHAECFNLENCSSYLSKQQIEYLFSKITSKDFLNGKCHANIQIRNEKIELSIENDDFSNNLLVVSCGDIEIAFQVRRFFSKLVYKNTSTNKICLVPQSHYAYIEKLQRSLRNLLEGDSDAEKLMTMAEMYHRNVIGALPL